MKNNKHSDLEVNGYKWYSFHKGIHSFQKKLDNLNKWVVIQCSDEQLINGDIEFMTEHGITLDKEQIKKIEKQYYI